MGPLSDLRIGNDGVDIQKTAIRWLDNNEGNKAMLQTNKSDDDLIYKEEVDPINNHRDLSKQYKRIIKPFQQTLAGVTGVHNIKSLKSLINLNQQSHRHTFSEADASKIITKIEVHSKQKSPSQKKISDQNIEESGGHLN